MRPYKLKFSRYEMSADQKATGQMKKIIQRQVRRQLNKETKKEVEDGCGLRSQQEDEKG
jgi:hypothetical protein